MEEILIVILLPILLLWICSARFTFISATLGPGPSRPASGARAGLVAQNQKDCDCGEGQLDHDGADRQHPEFALCFSVHGWSTGNANSCSGAHPGARLTVMAGSAHQDMRHLAIAGRI
jgi:hypothetical protein